MNNLLSQIGRASISLGAVFIVLAGVVIGSRFSQELMLAGGLLGLLVAGTVFGLVAAVYDIQQNLRILVARKTELQ